MIVPQIIYQNDDFLVINKPAGMIVNNADTSRDEFTVQDWVEEKIKKQKENSNNVETDFEKRGGIVHRLDKETSGALIIALTEDAFTKLQSQFKNREVEKVYLALCHGQMVAEGEINVPIGRLPWNRMRFGVIPQGRESYTKFKTLKHFTFVNGREKEKLSLVEVYPKTGRTHQIRVHLQYAGHPIFADSLYSGRKTYARDKKFLGRHFLHASKITITNPVTEKRQTFEAPLVAELSSFLDFIA